MFRRTPKNDYWFKYITIWSKLDWKWSNWIGWFWCWQQKNEINSVLNCFFSVFSDVNAVSYKKLRQNEMFEYRYFWDIFHLQKYNLQFRSERKVCNLHSNVCNVRRYSNNYHIFQSMVNDILVGAIRLIH